MVAVKAQTGELIINGRYILRGSLGMGGVGLVQRAFDRLAGAEVALKRVAPPSPQPIPPHETLADPRVTLAQEFRTLASLRHPNIVSVLDYGFDANDRPYFTMELIEDAENLLHAGRGQSVEARIRLLIQVLQALVYLHHRNILHRDLSPRNVLVAGGAAKMIDFGLSVDRNQQTGIGGTLAYIAPEVLRGSPPSIASDLYAFGVLAYELFSGRHPFDTSSPSVLIDEILDKAPDVAALGLPAIMTAALERTLAKQPDQRPQSAADLMALCYECIGQRAPVESTTMRESFLQAARLVGREREMAYLFGA
ncbi:MAG: serine/threonine protein kinase, partial [Anaerolineae bacterium]|nr:serine/threonine protein kinase [Anaerolineae bacterium]